MSGGRNRGEGRRVRHRRGRSRVRRDRLPGRRGAAGDHGQRDKLGGSAPTTAATLRRPCSKRLGWPPWPDAPPVRGPGRKRGGGLPGGDGPGAAVSSRRGPPPALVPSKRREPGCSFRSSPRVTYCEPEVASVGLTEEQAEEAGGPTLSESLKSAFRQLADRLG
ncbi:MAG TPA: hypothetical protein VNO34_05670 [Actinomycetota bacterium]|nr:hypothetical protein [Actinomycetota bacterium]